MKKYRIAVIAIALFALATGYVLNRRDAGNSNTTPTTAPVQRIAATSAAPSDRSNRAASHKFLPKALSKPAAVGPLFKPMASLSHPAQLVAEAEIAARNGSASAMYWMSLALKKCKDADMSTDEQIESKVAKRSLGREAMDRDNGRMIDPNQVAQNAAGMVRNLEQLRDECKTLPAEEIDSWQTWLQKSAAAGNGAARDAFAHLVMNEFKDPSYLEENYAEFAAQNELAIEYLNDSVASGDCSNDVLNGFRWVRLQPAQKYVYQSLIWKHGLDYFATDTQSSPARIDTEVAGLNALIKNLASEVPADQLADAENASNYILQNVCRF